MTDLAAQLSALLREAELREPHAPECASRDASRGLRPQPCTCDRPERLREKIAGATADAILGYVSDDEGMCSHEMSDAAEVRWEKDIESRVGAFTRALTGESYITTGLCRVCRRTTAHGTEPYRCLICARALTEETKA